MRSFVCCAVEVYKCEGAEHFVGSVFYGHSHQDAIRAMRDHVSWFLDQDQLSKVLYTEGFVDSDNKFITRESGRLVWQLTS
jgi:hypothetical protein